MRWCWISPTLILGGEDLGAIACVLIHVIEGTLEGILGASIEIIIDTVILQKSIKNVAHAGGEKGTHLLNPL
jgi:hypothetical protein